MQKFRIFNDDSRSIKKVLKQAGVVHNTKPTAKQLNCYFPTVLKYHAIKQMHSRDIILAGGALLVKSREVLIFQMP